VAATAMAWASPSVPVSLVSSRRNALSRRIRSRHEHSTSGMDSTCPRRQLHHVCMISAFPIHASRESRAARSPGVRAGCAATTTSSQLFGFRHANRRAGRTGPSPGGRRARARNFRQRRTRPPQQAVRSIRLACSVRLVSGWCQARRTPTSCTGGSGRLRRDAGRRGLAARH
jgi:hypothetical protein